MPQRRLPVVCVAGAGPRRVVVAAGPCWVVVVFVFTVLLLAFGPRRRVMRVGLEERVVVVAGRRR